MHVCSADRSGFTSSGTNATTCENTAISHIMHTQVSFFKQFTDVRSYCQLADFIYCSTAQIIASPIYDCTSVLCLTSTVVHTTLDSTSTDI
jgi:hypothetical protein